MSNVPTLTPDGLLSKDARGLDSALIPTGGYRSAHAPALLELPGGDLLCAWFAGSFEGNAVISVVCARLPKGATAWLPPVKVSGDPQRSDQNPSLFIPPGKTEVWLMYTAQLDRAPGKSNMQFTAVIRRQRSLDGGQTWQPADVVFDEPGSFCRQPIQALSSGRWLFGNWKCYDDDSKNGTDHTLFQLSDDQGQTWRQAALPGSQGLVHANLVDMGEGHVVVFLRSRWADWIYRAESRDDGETWTLPEATALPNNNASISAIRLRSGRIALAYNPTQAAHPAPGQACWPGLRCPVAVALSEDGGLTWPCIRTMEAGEGFCGAENAAGNSQYEYPCLLEGRDGSLHLAYAYKDRLAIRYWRFCEEDILGPKRAACTEYNPTAAQG